MFKKFASVLISLIIVSWFMSQAQNEANYTGYKIFYYPGGKIASEGTLINGKPDGLWKAYYSTGVLKSEGLRTNFLLDSIWNFYDNIGNLVESISYKNDKKNGYFLKYLYNSARGVNILVSKELYLNDVKEGTAYYYYEEDGKLKEVCEYKKGARDGVSEEYSKDSVRISIKTYRNDVLVERERINRFDDTNQKDGVWKDFHENGKVSIDCNYKNGLLDGLYKEYNAEGKTILAIRYKEGKVVTGDSSVVGDSSKVINEYDDKGVLVHSGSYKKDIPVGIHQYYNDQGGVIKSIVYNDNGIKISEGLIDNDGNKSGLWTDFYLNGSVRAQGKFLNNRRSGEWIYYYRDEKKQQIGYFEKGLPVDQWTWYYENDSVWRTEEFVNGKKEGKVVEYSRNGELIKQGEFFENEMNGAWKYKVGDYYEEGNYSMGLREGVWKGYYPNEKLYSEGLYIQGNPEGKHVIYYMDGSIREEQYYSSGNKERTWKKYDEAGNLILTISYKDNIEYRINGEKIDLNASNIKVIN